MALSFLLFLCLAVFALAWPQLPADDGTFGLSMTLPVPVTGGQGDQHQFAGILGLGHGQNYTVTYPNMMDELVAQGAIRTKAYSLALGSKTEQQGLLVLGGIDTAKYSGHLAALPVIPAEHAPDRVARFWVNLRSLALTPPSGVTRAPYVAAAGLPVFLDSGATMTLLPRALADAVAADFGAPPSNSSDDPEASHSFYEVDCSMADAPGTLDFSFGSSLTIRVPYAEMVRRTRADPPRCVLGFVPDDDFALLGDTFLRSAYAVFDLESDVVYMAQYRNCGERQMAVRRVQDIHAIVGLCEAPATGAALGGKPAQPSQAVAAPDTTPTEDATSVTGPGVVGVSAAAGLSLSRAWIWSIAFAMVSVHLA
ncbi:candidapepsin-8 [Verticillium alfalfae VaMs.102]|uniref:Candidapepsin-8 n=1 Tax=Verticillium alfalfae (strain VaMs.102 / ATCC MYA-4576 / FGSC 10136) TaxID=526221 RepID=C9SS71_VERA1|nr:candidapepsin-8 [Verticillium alfalfae VaMs.102]EEY21636.1 candidapepsin-8 [Verticillium alfalfae VaMs.102]